MPQHTSSTGLQLPPLLSAQEQEEQKALPQMPLMQPHHFEKINLEQSDDKKRNQHHCPTDTFQKPEKQELQPLSSREIQQDFSHSSRYALESHEKSLGTEAASPDARLEFGRLQENQATAEKTYHGNIDVLSADKIHDAQQKHQKVHELTESGRIERSSEYGVSSHRPWLQMLEDNHTERMAEVSWANNQDATWDKHELKISRRQNKSRPPQLDTTPEAFHKFAVLREQKASLNQGSLKTSSDVQKTKSEIEDNKNKENHVYAKTHDKKNSFQKQYSGDNKLNLSQDGEYGEYSHGNPDKTESQDNARDSASTNASVGGVSTRTVSSNNNSKDKKKSGDTFRESTDICSSNASDDGKPASSLSHSHKREVGGEEGACSDEDYIVEQRERDRQLPAPSIVRIMKSVLPEGAKISKDAKEAVQEAASEFILFLATEASDHCAYAKRKTLSSEDILRAMNVLGFEKMAEAMAIFVCKFKELNKGVDDDGVDNDDNDNDIDADDDEDEDDDADDDASNDDNDYDGVAEEDEDDRNGGGYSASAGASGRSGM